MLDIPTLILVAGTFLIAGTVKGVIGLGLPVISLGLLTATLDLTSAMALLLLPSFVTNLWQAVVGGHFAALLSRIWLFLLMAISFVWLGAMALTQVDLALLSALLGVLLIAYSVFSLVGFRLTVSMGQEVWVGPLLGTINGILTGMTGAFTVPGVMYLQSIGLPRDQLIQAMGMLFMVSTLALGLALQTNGLLTTELGALSASAIVPALVGMGVGQKIRQRLSEALFRKVFSSRCWCWEATSFSMPPSPFTEFASIHLEN